VSGTQPLLATCLPDAVPTKIDPPERPELFSGVQLVQPPYPLLGRADGGQGEDEICMATYYDVSALVPESARVDCVAPWLQNGMNPDGGCFAWNHQLLLQDPQSHHSIVTIYPGTTADPKAVDPDGSPWWGPWSKKIVDHPDCDPSHWDDRNSPREACQCDPVAEVDPELGYAPGCSGRIQTDIACIGFGPPDGRSFGLGGASNQLLLSQQARHDLALTPGAFAVMPVKGIIYWNSHAFNRTTTDTTLEQYLNLTFAEEHTSQVQQIFEAQWIFAEFVDPFQQLEVCGSFTVPQGARVFQLSSHTHERGVNWRTWAPPNEPCRPDCSKVSIATRQFFGCDDTRACASGPRRGEQCTFWGRCSENEALCRGDRDCASGFCQFNLTDAHELCGGEGCQLLPVCETRGPDSEFYQSIEYSDPLNKFFDPPLAYDSPDAEDRTFLFCSEFDNGATDRAVVKRQSTSPFPPSLDLSVVGLGGELPPDHPLVEAVLGGPCPDHVVACMDGPNQGELCAGEDAATFCETAAGLGDGVCDACPVHGGITTEDEMFILLGNYFVAPEPSQVLLALAGLGTVGLLVRSRRPRH
jgi:hypothetical protein